MVTSTWDLTFLEQPQFVDWLEQQFSLAPLPHGVLLVDYVRERIALSKSLSPLVPSPHPPLRSQSNSRNSFSPSSNPSALLPPITLPPPRARMDGISDIFDMDSYAVDSPASASFATTDSASTFDPYPSVQQPSFHFNSESKYAIPPVQALQPTSYYSHQDPSLRSEPMAIDPSFIAPSQLIAPSALFPALAGSASSSRSSSASSSIQPEGNKSVPAQGKAQVEALNLKNARAKETTIDGPSTGTKSNPSNPATPSTANKPSIVSKPTTSKSTTAASSKPLASTSKLPAPSATPLESEQWSKIYPSLKENLTPVRFTKAPLQTVNKVASFISMFTIDP